jgi:plastocyanin
MRLRRTLLATLLPAALLGPAFVQLTPAAAGGICHSESVTEAKGQTVAMRDNCFWPMVLRAAPGETVTFVNRDTEPHTVTGAGDWGTGYKELRTGQKFQVRFAEPGLYLFDCVIHPGMVGAVYVDKGKGIRVAHSRSVTVASAGSTSDETDSGEAEPADGLETETASVTEEGPPVGSGAMAVLGVAVLGTGYGLGRLRRRTHERRAG